MGVVVIRIISLLAVILVVSVCGSTTASYYESPDQVVASATQYEFGDRFTPIFQFIGADDGAKFTVTPGGYIVEVYTYRNESPETWVLEGSGRIVIVDRNALLVFHTTDRNEVDAILSDIAR